jgi:hypothetical protein
VEREKHHSKPHAASEDNALTPGTPDEQGLQASVKAESSNTIASKDQY